MPQQSMKEKGSIHKKSEAPQKTNWLDRLGDFWIRVHQYGKEFVGIGILAVFLITVLALFEITKGALVSPWRSILISLFGWGSYIFAFFILLVGIVTIKSAQKTEISISLRRIVLIETIFFLFLALLSQFAGLSVERTQMGIDGGLVGWAIASMVSSVFSPTGATIIFAVLFMTLLYYLTGLNRRVGKWLDQWSSAGEVIESAEDSQEGCLIDGVKGDSVSGVIPLRSNRLPPLNLLMNDNANRPDDEHIRATAERIEKSLAEFGVPARVVGYRIGPTVTQFAVEPGFVERAGPDGQISRQKVRVAQISALSRDLALALSAERLRIEAPVPGRSFVGIEVPNLQITTVRLRSILESDLFINNSAPLLIALGRDVSGLPLAADLGRMPHILIAGTTGSGKSVCIAALTVCLILNNTPDELQLAMLDPKMVELIRFNGLPHLLGNVETEITRMLAVLRWALDEMDRRYKVFEQEHTRDLQAYNKKMERRGLPKLPRIVVMIDELADLMMSSPDQTEHALIRLAQMARATGLHLVVATQRPSTDVVTGLIKANFPARLSFSVASSIDSRVILDTNDAEALLGRGDMLFLNPEIGTPVRAQGVMVTDQEIERVIGFWQKSSPKDSTAPIPPWEKVLQDDENENDSLVDQASQIVRNSQRASASMLQRRLRIGYPRAARLLDELEEMGVVGPSMGGGRERDVLLPPDDDAEDEDQID